MDTEIVQLSSASGKKSSASIEVGSFTTSQRLIKTFVRSTLLLVCAAAGAIVPPHVILPPLFIAAAIYVGRATFVQKSFIASGQGECPECQAAFRILRRPHKLPFTDICEGCKREITVMTAK